MAKQSVDKLRHVFRELLKDFSQEGISTDRLIELARRREPKAVRDAGDFFEKTGLTKLVNAEACRSASTSLLEQPDLFGGFGAIPNSVAVFSKGSNSGKKIWKSRDALTVEELEEVVRSRTKQRKPPQQVQSLSDLLDAVKPFSRPGIKIVDALKAKRANDVKPEHRQQ